MENNLNEKLKMLQYLQRKLHIRTRMENGLISDTGQGQGRILALLKMRDGISIKEISFLLGLSPSSMSEMLSKLEKSGYIIREQDTTDKRITIVKLTEKGKKEEQAKTFKPDDIFDCLDKEEQTTFGEYLDKINGSIKATLGYDDKEVNERMDKANQQIEELIKHFHQRYGRGHEHHSIDTLHRRKDWLRQRGFSFNEGQRNAKREDNN